MPRTRGKYKTYSQETLETAMFKVMNRECSMRRASIDYGIPKTTLFDKLCGNTPLITTQGPSPVLTYTEERKLAQWLKNMSRIGYGQTRQQLKMMVKKILDEDGRHNPFKNNTPGNDWFRRFKRRHPGLTERVGESLGKERAMLSVKKLEKWFGDLETYLEEEGGGVGIMSDPTRIFNCDESGFPLNGKTMKVLAPTGCRTVYQLTNSDKSQITVLACINAAGTYIPPMLIFPGQRFKYNPLRGTPDDWFLGRSESGWIDQEVFYEWVANHFVPTVKRANIEFPVILFLDGHRSHINLETANFCAENQVILYCFPAHASHILQPCDLSLFKSLKNCWKKEVQQWQVDNPGQNVTKQNFASIFYRAWKDSAFTITARNGFKAAGLYPFTKAFDHAKVAPSEVFQRAEEAEDEDDDGMPILSPVRIYDFDDEEEADDADYRLPQTGFQSPIRQRNSHAAGLARKALEGTFTPEKLWVYEKRFREGFDVETDDLYNTWKKLKVQETNQRAPPPRFSPSRSSVLTSTYVSPCLEQYLRYPKAPESRRPIRVRKELPKAISGLRYRQYLEEKQSAKEEMEKTKKKKKEIREAKKIEKSRLLKEKKKRMEEKKSQAKRPPVCRKLSMTDPSPQTSGEILEDNERDVYGGVGIGMENDMMAYDRPNEHDEINALEETGRRDNVLKANTIVSLQLDENIVFPRHPKKQQPHEDVVTIPKSSSSQEDVGLISRQGGAVESPNDNQGRGSSETAMTSNDTLTADMIMVSKMTERGQIENGQQGNSLPRDVGIIINTQVLTQIGTPNEGEGQEVELSSFRKNVIEPPVIELGPMLPISGVDGRTHTTKDLPVEEAPPALGKMGEGELNLIDKDTTTETMAKDVPAAALEKVVNTSDNREDGNVPEQEYVETATINVELDETGRPPLTEGTPSTVNIEMTSITGEEGESLETQVGEVLAQVMEEISAITSSGKEAPRDSAGEVMRDEEDESGELVIDESATSGQIEEASVIDRAGPSGSHKEAQKKTRKKEKMKMLKKGTKRKCYYEEEEETNSARMEQQIVEKDDWTQIDENVCDVCQESYCNNDDDWVGCEWCPRWFHKECTDIADILGMSEQEIHSVDWYCHHCM